MAVGRTRQHSSADIWPGFVDALAALLIIVIFLLMVFTLAQYFLSDILTGRDRALDRLNRQVAQLTEMLSLEQAENTELEASVSRLTLQLGGITAERDRLSDQLAELLPERDMLTGEVASLTAERDALKAASAKTAAELEDAYKTIDADKEKIELQLRRLASLERDIAALREVRDALEKKVAGLEDSLQSRDRELGALRDRSKELVAELASARERTRLAQIEIDDRDVRLRDLGTRASAAEEELTAEQAVSAEAREQVRILNLQIAALRQQLARIEAALETSEAKAKEQNVRIVNLSKRLNAALASKVQELANFRSEFFGRLRKALGNRSDVRIVGDRFVFQSEVLFPSGQAELQPGGRVQIDKLAKTIKEIADKIPDDIDWVLRVDGHTDRLPIKTPAFPSNWELSTGRAIAVVKYLIQRGVPANRLAATGFGEFQPLDPSNSIAAFRRNRRIEFKLTQR
ncbi:MAG: peptidoglycan -binding protein [Defluviicoccus sp.]|nr:peptidoglycan -binding protein [Defluviicoccus sp.]